MAFKDDITIGDKYGPAMTITSQEQADEYFVQCVEHTMRVQPTDDRAEAESIERQNLGYFAGYYGNETRRRVERLFHCAHPIFGAIAEQPTPTPEEALEMGKRLGEGDAGPY